MGTHKNYVNKKTHGSFLWLQIMSMHRNYMNKKMHSSFFICCYKFKI